MTETIEDLFAERKAAPDAMSPHMGTLRKLAEECDVCVEFGVRRANSTVALLAGCEGRVYSYDLEAAHPGFYERIRAAVGDRWIFEIGDSRSIAMPICDLLLHDSLHNYEHVKAELEQCVGGVRKFLVFHDTESHGDVGQAVSCGPPVKGVDGLKKALNELVATGDWALKAHYAHSAGLTVLERVTDDSSD